MAAAASFQRPSRSNNPLDLGSNTVSSYKTPGINIGSRKKLTLSTSLGHGSRVSPQNKQKSLQGYIDTSMSSYAATSTIPTSTSTRKLHKRNSSSNSLPASPSYLSSGHSQSPIPYATFEDPLTSISTTSTPTSSTPKIKPYLRKLSSNNKDAPNEARLDLSKSTVENGNTLAGLGINDYTASRAASEVTFSHHSGGRHTPHMRTTSGTSQISTGSGSYKPTQPFVHPMRQTPSASHQSYASSLTNEEEARESSDIVLDDDLVLGHGYRSRRSISISSTPQQVAPTPLSQSHTAEDLGMVPKFTSSQTNVSLKSSSSRLKGRERGNTGSRSVGSERTSAELQEQERRRVTELRQEFAEREASKSRRRQKEQMRRTESDLAKEAKREERHRRKSEAEDRKMESERGEKGRGGVTGRSYDSMRAGHITALPSARHAGYTNEKGGYVQEAENGKSEGGWHKFVRAMSCGG